MFRIFWLRKMDMLVLTRTAEFLVAAISAVTVLGVVGNGAPVVQSAFGSSGFWASFRLPM